jgi:hypothetical protein
MTMVKKAMKKGMKGMMRMKKMKMTMATMEVIMQRRKRIGIFLNKI